MSSKSVLNITEILFPWRSLKQRAKRINISTQVARVNDESSGQKMFNFPFFTKKKREKERKEKRENLIKISLSPCIHPPFVVRFLSSYFFLSSFLSFCLEEHKGGEHTVDSGA